MRLALALLLAAAASMASAQNTVTLDPVGEYAEIDTSAMTQAIDALFDASTREETVAAVTANPGAYAPPVLMVLSEAIRVDGGDIGEAAFWFYAAQLRARGDANLVTDPTAAGAVDQLNQRFGPAINQAMFADLDALESVVTRVAEWDAETPRDYDPRWIALSGMGAMTAAQEGEAVGEILIPEADREATVARVRDEYMAGFRAALAQARGQ